VNDICYVLSTYVRDYCNYIVRWKNEFLLILDCRLPIGYDCTTFEGFASLSRKREDSKCFIKVRAKKTNTDDLLANHLYCLHVS
jgi:hypothetical protein